MPLPPHPGQEAISVPFSPVSSDFKIGNENEFLSGVHNWHFIPKETRWQEISYFWKNFYYYK
jgi:hypothetical protein